MLLARSTADRARELPTRSTRPSPIPTASRPACRSSAGPHAIFAALLNSRSIVRFWVVGAACVDGLMAAFPVTLIFGGRQERPTLVEFDKRLCSRIMRRLAGNL